MKKEARERDITVNRRAFHDYAIGERFEAGLVLVGRVKMEIATESSARLEYAELRDPETLEEVAEFDSPALLGVAVWVGGVRLIDNRLLVPGGSRR